VATREQLRDHFWLARIGCREGTHAAADGLPPVHQAPADGLTVLLRDPGASLVTTEVGQVARALRGERTQAAALLEAVVGYGGGAIHLSPCIDRWKFYWPDASRLLWIYSPLRAPSLWDIGTAAAAVSPPVVELSAFGGDLVVAVSDPTLAGDAGELTKALVRGGPAALDLLAAGLSAAPSRFSGCLVEVR
jgi:hypothetical protein